MPLHLKTGVGDLALITEPVLCPILTPARLYPPSIGRFRVRCGGGLGLGNHIEISTRGVIIWQGVENGHNTGFTD